MPTTSRASLCSVSHLHEHDRDGSPLKDVGEGQEGDVPVLRAQGHARAADDDGVRAGVGHHAGVREHDALGVALRGRGEAIAMW